MSKLSEDIYRLKLCDYLLVFCLNNAKKSGRCLAFTAFLFTFAGDTRGAWTGVQAEIIPMEPDTGNADAGMSLDYDILSTPYFILTDMYLYNKIR